MVEADNKTVLQPLKKRIDIINKFRLAFMFVALLLLVLIFWGNKFFDGQAWFAVFMQKSYAFATWDLLFMLIATFLKLFFVIRYNKEVKKMQK